MKRSEMREQAFFLTFENLFDKEERIEELIELYSENVEPVCDYAKDTFSGICQIKEIIIDTINNYSKSWKTTRLPKVTLSLLMLAIYEMKYVDSVPDSVAINEAVELAKKYAGADDASYINGVLGAVSRGE